MLEEWSGRHPEVQHAPKFWYRADAPDDERNQVTAERFGFYAVLPPVSSK